MLGKRERAGSFSLIGGLYTLCHALFALPLGVFGRLCFLIVGIPG